MKDYNELINKIIEQGLVPKDEAWYFCNQLFWALRNESIDNYIQRLKSANFAPYDNDSWRKQKSFRKRRIPKETRRRE